jgi:membrane-associated phospholipid phosphatase
MLATLVSSAASAQLDAGPAPRPSSAASEQAAPKPADHGVVVQLARDVAGDYKHFFSTENAIWLGIGGGAALGAHAADESIAEHVQRSNPDLDGGEQYGSQRYQVPVAIGWWIAGAAAGSERNAATGRDLFRAQVAAFSWTYAIKYATQRTRPNGDPHSFPSGHASTSFATAMVLQQHFGWKLGVPAFALAGYTAVSRVGENQHWTSDVVFGAALGMVCGRTVTVRLRDTKVSVAPVPVRRGGGVLLTVQRLK